MCLPQQPAEWGHSFHDHWKLSTRWVYIFFQKEKIATTKNLVVAETYELVTLRSFSTYNSFFSNLHSLFKETADKMIQSVPLDKYLMGVRWRVATFRAQRRLGWGWRGSQHFLNSKSIVGSLYIVMHFILTEAYEVSTIITCSSQRRGLSQWQNK